MFHCGRGKIWHKNIFIIHTFYCSIKSHISLSIILLSVILYLFCWIKWFVSWKCNDHWYYVSNVILLWNLFYYFGIILYLKKICEDDTESSCVRIKKVTLMLTSDITMVHLSRQEINAGKTQLTYRLYSE